METTSRVAAAVALATLGGLGLGWASRRGRTTSSTPTPSPSPRPKTAPAPGAPKVSGNDHSAERLPAFLDLVRETWPIVVGGTPTERELQIVAAISWLESGIGGWWTGDMAGGRNKGGIQCFQRDLDGTPPAHYRCAKHPDKKQLPDGSWKPYVTGFRYYQDAEAADVLAALQRVDGWKPKQPVSGIKPAEWWSVFDFLVELGPPHRGPIMQAIERGDDVDAIAQIMRAQNYHGTPPADYAAAIRTHLPAIAAAMNSTPIAGIETGPGRAPYGGVHPRFVRVA